MEASSRVATVAAGVSLLMAGWALAAVVGDTSGRTLPPGGRWVLIGVVVAAIALGAAMMTPPRRGLWGYLSGATLICSHALATTVSVFAGWEPITDETTPPDADALMAESARQSAILAALFVGGLLMFAAARLTARRAHLASRIAATPPATGADVSPGAHLAGVRGRPAWRSPAWGGGDWRARRVWTAILGMVAVAGAHGATVMYAGAFQGFDLILGSSALVVTAAALVMTVTQRPWTGLTTVATAAGALVLMMHPPRVIAHPDSIGFDFTAGFIALSLMQTVVAALVAEVVIQVEARSARRGLPPSAGTAQSTTAAGGSSGPIQPAPEATG